jgi:hypothetical protein
MSKFDDFAKAVKDGTRSIAKDLFKDLEKQAVQDTKAFLESSKADLKTWTKQLASKELTKTEFRDLVKGQQNLAKLHALAQMGVTLTKLDRFRTRLINLVVDSAFNVFL